MVLINTVKSLEVLAQEAERRLGGNLVLAVMESFLKAKKYFSSEIEPYPTGENDKFLNAYEARRDAYALLEAYLFLNRSEKKKRGN